MTVNKTARCIDSLRVPSTRFPPGPRCAFPSAPLQFYSSLALGRSCRATPACVVVLHKGMKYQGEEQQVLEMTRGLGVISVDCPSRRMGGRRNPRGEAK